jgi:short-subunit dehydrogenase
MELRGKRVLITGASRGIGAALAREFARAGSTVALVARSADAIGKLAADLGGTAHPADLADPEQVRTLIQHVEDEAGPIDVLVNNAGVDHTGPFDAMSADELDGLLRVNLTTPAELCRQVIPRMLRRGGGHIVNVSSLSGVAAFPGLTAYSTSKAGLTHLTAGLRADLRGLPIGTTVVELGAIPTEMIGSVRGYAPTDHSFRRFERLQLLRDTSADKVAEAVVGAVAKGRRHVRYPRRAVPFPMLTEAPRRIAEVLLTGVKHQS